MQESIAVMRPLRLGIVGAGFIADVIANSIREADSVALAAVASRRVETAQALAAKHSGVRVFGGGNAAACIF